MPGAGGEYPAQSGYGWTNGMLIELLARYGDELTVRPVEQEVDIYKDEEVPVTSMAYLMPSVGCEDTESQEILSFVTSEQASICMPGLPQIEVCPICAPQNFENEDDCACSSQSLNDDRNQDLDLDGCACSSPEPSLNDVCSICKSRQQDNPCNPGKENKSKPFASFTCGTPPVWPAPVKLKAAKAPLDHSCICADASAFAASRSPASRSPPPPKPPAPLSKGCTCQENSGRDSNAPRELKPPSPPCQKPPSTTTKNNNYNSNKTDLSLCCCCCDSIIKQAQPPPKPEPPCCACAGSGSGTDAISGAVSCAVTASGLHQPQAQQIPKPALRPPSPPCAMPTPSSHPPCTCKPSPAECESERVLLAAESAQPARAAQVSQQSQTPMVLKPRTAPFPMQPTATDKGCTCKPAAPSQPPMASKPPAPLSCACEGGAGREAKKPTPQLLCACASDNDTFSCEDYNEDDWLTDNNEPDDISLCNCDNDAASLEIETIPKTKVFPLGDSMETATASNSFICKCADRKSQDDCS